MSHLSDDLTPAEYIAASIGDLVPEKKRDAVAYRVMDCLRARLSKDLGRTGKGVRVCAIMVVEAGELIFHECERSDDVVKPAPAVTPAEPDLFAASPHVAMIGKP